FLTLTSNDIDHKMDEDTFAHRYLHLLLEEVFNIDDYKFVWHKLGFETFGILIDGSNIKLFSMDLNFNGVYRLNQIRKMTLPTEHANILTIIPVISNFYSLLKRVNHAIEKLNAPSTPMD
ncbi:10898_t:CDS:2, partial [Entrophospora sp. SA101]